MYMKRVFISIFFLIPILGYAKSVDEDISRIVATNFFKSRIGIIADLKLVHEGERVHTKAGQDTPSYYIYNKEDGGFVIIAGDDCVCPIIGYATNGSIPVEHMPDNFKAWLDMWTNVIDGLTLKGVTEPDAQKQWSDYYSGNNSASTKAENAEMLLETAKWDQAYPYNLQCPKDGAELSLTGCTATATCIIMRYHKWPISATGTVPAYVTSTKKIQVPSITLGAEYQWDKMPLVYTGNETPEQNDAVALLMSQVGAMIMSDYASEGTGSHSYFVTQVLNKYLKYDKSFVNLSAVNYEKKEWIEMIKNNIENVGPLFYSGYGEGGHAFVVDGYDSADLIHINWGWSGYGDGYFNYPYFNEYTNGQSAIFNIFKDAGGEYVDNLELYFDKSSEAKGLKVNVDVFETGTNFNAAIHYVSNLSVSDFNGEIGIGKWNKYGSLDEVCGISKAEIQSFYANKIDIPGCKITTNIAIGDYLAPMYRSTKTPQWTKIPYDLKMEDVNGIIYLTDPYSLEERTSIMYNYVDGTCTITTKDETSVILKDLSGENLVSHYKTEGNTTSIDVKSLPKGYYTLILDRGEEHKEIVMKF